MTKEEKIQEAYGLYWKDYGHLADENGFIYQSDLFYPDTEMKKEGVEIEVISVEQKHKCSNIKWRPKSLSGIETNNGWTKIESEEDLPVKGIDCHFILKSGVQGIFINLDDAEYLTLKNRGTHYKPIETKSPIY